ncbi:MAG: putative serine protease [Rhodanobacteraceae bacterium]|jgi:autotransporter-associated beta strand protein|nr:MAG: putative serine protease [Rhodanobacteraceae bacterium]
MKKPVMTCFVGAAAVGLSLGGCGGGGSIHGTVGPPNPPVTAGYDPTFNQLVPTGVQTAQTAGFTGKGVKVGIMGFGVDPTTPPLQGRIAWFKSYLPDGSQTPNDTTGHGTVVADILGGLPQGVIPFDNGETFPGGVAQDTGLYVEQVCAATGNPPCTWNTNNFNDFVSEQVRVINVSLGEGNVLTEFTGPNDPNIPLVQAIYQPAVNAGIILVWVAGNDGHTQPWQDAGLPYWIPSFQPNWLAVVNIAIDSNGNPAGLYKGADEPSNACGVAAQWCIGAPGVVFTPTPNVPNTVFNGGGVGTSFAAPIISGVAAQVLQAFPWMSAGNVTDTVLTTATPLDDGSHQTPNATFGWGMVNAAKAIKGPAQFAFPQFGPFLVPVPVGMNSVFANDISGSGGLKVNGTGTLTLSGVDTYMGSTEIASGALAVTGSITSATTVDAGGTLAGTGVVNADVTNNGTVVSQGSKPAQGLTIDGDLTDGASSTIAVALGDPLQVKGTANVAGTMNVLAAAAGYIVKATENLLTANNVAGSFGQLTFASGVFYTGSLSYTGTQVNVALTQTNVTQTAAAMGIVDPASVSGAQRVQAGFDSINATMASGGVPALAVLQGASAIQHSATLAAAHATLQSLSGQLHATSAAMLFDGIDTRSDALFEHFDDLLSGRARPGVWYSDLGWQGNLQQTGYAGATFRSSGGMAGADTRIGAHALLGFAVGQSAGFGQLDTAWDHDRTSMDNVTIYGGMANGPWYASAQIASGWYREDMQRLLQLGALGTTVGNYSTGRYAAVAFEGGRELRLGTMRVTPFADLRYQRLDLGGFAEQGGLGYGLKADAHIAERLQAGLGLRAVHGWRLTNGMQMAFDGSASWQHALHQNGNVFDASFTGFNNWLPVEGIGISRNMAILRSGLSLWPTRSFGLHLGYMREQGPHESSSNVMLQGAIKF